MAIKSLTGTPSPGSSLNDGFTEKFKVFCRPPQTRNNNNIPPIIRDWSARAPGVNLATDAAAADAANALLPPTRYDVHLTLGKMPERLRAVVLRLRRLPALLTRSPTLSSTLLLVEIPASGFYPRDF